MSARLRVFVTVGNAHVPFDRLTRMVDEARRRAGVAIEGVCQLGTSTFCPEGLRPERMLGRLQFEDEIRRAELVVCHAGVGTLSTCLRLGKRPVAIARRASLGECVNEHQMDIVDELARSGRIAAVEDAGQLASLLTSALVAPASSASAGAADVGGVVHELLRAEIPPTASWRRLLVRLLSYAYPAAQRLEVPAPHAPQERRSVP